MSDVNQIFHLVLNKIPLGPQTKIANVKSMSAPPPQYYSGGPKDVKNMAKTRHLKLPIVMMENAKRSSHLRFQIKVSSWLNQFQIKYDQKNLS